MAKTLVGVFDDLGSAQGALNELKAAGIPDRNLRLMDSDDASTRWSGGEVPWTEKVSGWFRSLFDDEDDRNYADDYSEALRRGNYVLVADVGSERVDDVSAIMNRYGSVDMRERRQRWSEKGYEGYDASAPAYTAEQRAQEMSSYQQDKQGETIPVVQEELALGKRVVQRGGVRIHSYVEERPVEEMMRLREERITVDRRPADRPAEAGDLAFQERTLEVEAMGEEPIVEKRARVVEEVVVGKAVEERTQPVKETVRRKDVKVEQASADKARAQPRQPAPRHR